MGDLIFILGGAKSGKTRFALETCQAFPDPRLYLATAEAWDDEMTERIRRHQAERGPGWFTIEEPLDPALRIRELKPGQTSVVLLDCLTLWMSNLLGQGHDTDRITIKAAELVDSVRSAPCPAVLVSNEVGQGIVPDNALARQFRDAAGAVHQIVARAASEVYFVITGLPQRLKQHWEVRMNRRFLTALQFMTVFRFRSDLNETSQDMAESVGYYPAVGLFLGLLLTIGYAVFSSFFPPLVSGVLLVLMLAILTHGLHLDGLSDTADALFSHRSLERKLEIMKDSRVGVFGAAALLLILILKVSLVAELVRKQAWPVMILFPVWGRLATSITAALSQYARPQGGLGQPFVNLAGKRELYLAGVISLLVSLVLMGIIGLVAALIVGLAAVGGVHVWRRQLGGVTGDILGAVVELGEILGLLIAVAAI